MLMENEGILQRQERSSRRRAGLSGIKTDSMLRFSFPSTKLNHIMLFCCGQIHTEQTKQDKRRNFPVMFGLHQTPLGLSIFSR